MEKFLKIAGVITLLLLVYLLFQRLFALLAMVGYLVYALVTGALQPSVLENIEPVLDNPLFSPFKIDAMALGLFLSAVAMLLFIHFTKLFRLRWSLFRSIAFRPLMYSTVLVFTSMFALNIFVQWLPLENILENEFVGLSHTLLGAFTISVLAPLLEEVMFRGAIQGYMLRNLRSPWLAIAVSALVFGVFHMNPVQVVYATLLGIIFGWMYYRTGSLMSVIVGHVLNNTMATIMTLALGTESESELLENYVPEGTALGIEIVAFLFFAALSVRVAVKLHRSLSPVPSPWHDSDEQAGNVGEIL